MTDPAQNVRLLCLDVDGVLTDGSILIDDRGIETKRFHVRDGTAVKLWTQLGNHVAIITARRGGALRHRMNELNVRHVISGASDKAAAFADLLADLDLGTDQAAMLGDDLADMPVLRVCGYPMAVADAVADVRDLCLFQTVRPGGRGAVREAVEHLLKEQGRWDEALSLYD